MPGGCGPCNFLVSPSYTPDAWTDSGSGVKCKIENRLCENDPFRVLGDIAFGNLFEWSRYFRTLSPERDARLTEVSDIRFVR